MIIRLGLLNPIFLERGVDSLLSLSTCLSLSQGYQEHRSETPGPLEEDRLQHPGLERPNQHSERLRHVTLAINGARGGRGEGAGHTERVRPRVARETHGAVSQSGDELQGQLLISLIQTQRQQQALQEIMQRQI